MTVVIKRIGYILLIIAVIIIPALTLSVIFSCERFDYERVIIIETGSATEKTFYSAEIKGQIIDLGEGGITQHGHIWAEKDDNKELTVNLGTKTSLGPRTARGSFTSTITGLLPGTDYKMLAYATNSQGTVYGSEESFKTSPVPGYAPVADFTADPTRIPEGEIVEFTDLSSNDPTSWEWDFGDGGTSMDQNPSYQYTTIGLYTVSLTVSNGYGSDTKIRQDYITVAALHNPPVADFTAAQTAISAGESVQFFDLSYNTPTSWNWDFGDGGSSTLQDPQHYYETVGIYSVSLIVSNPYGSDTLTKVDLITVNGSTIETGIYIDSRDDHEYKWVKIGEQVWMAENLAYLPNVSPSSDWSGTEGLYYVYGYEGSVVSEAKTTFNYATYGVLYNWPAAMSGAAGSDANPSGVKGICPDGWHLPSYAEWTDLINYLGGESTAGGALKEAGLEHWASPNTGATNISGFTGLPGGSAYYYTGSDSVSFNSLNSFGFWWTTSDVGTDQAYIMGLGNESASINKPNDYKSAGNSVRCVKDGGSLKKQIPVALDGNQVVLKQRRDLIP